MTTAGPVKHDIAFLHTSPVHQPTFEKLIRDAAPGLSVRHDVREDLLADAQHTGANDLTLVARINEAMRDAGSTGAKVVVCTCSTIGGPAEGAQGAFRATRIDRAMADKAVTAGRPVLMVAALESTLAPTLALLESSASRLGMKPEIRTLVVEGAWAHFLAGDTPGYANAIVEAIGKAWASDSIVVLAQASMAPAAEPLARRGITALSSPQLGVAHALALHGKS
jgi:hypothetical protein